MTTYHTVFISYSHTQATLADRLKQDLSGHGLQVWIDHESLTPGTRSWEAAIRTGIAAADVVLYMASREALQSNNVQGELDVAEHYRKPIIPIWVAGEHWVEVVPMAMTKMQRIDAREPHYTQALQQLLNTLGVTIPKAAPHSIPHIPQNLTTNMFPIPTRLAQLGFIGVVIKSVKVIVPPVCNVPTGTFRRDDIFIFVSDFRIGCYPLTVAEYACAVSAGVVKVPKISGNVRWQAQQKRLDHPVVCITWIEARDYAAWLAQVTGQPWRLPTEAEWEKSAHWDAVKHASLLYPWGDQWDKARANTNDGGAKTTTPIGNYVEQSDASPVGAHDMAGNVWEWTSSIYNVYYPYNRNQVNKDDDISSPRVLRGGSLKFDPRYARATDRVGDFPGDFAYDVGMRLARGVTSGT